MQEKRILVISRSAWNDNNNTGNTLSSFFNSFPRNNIANIYCREELPNNKICDSYLQISERRILQRFCGKHVEVSKEMNGVKVFGESKDDFKLIENENRTYRFFKRHRFIIFLWLRELIWSTNLWKNKQLHQFIDDFKPDIIYSAMHDSIYMYNILLYVQKITQKPIVTFHGDDHLVNKGSLFKPFAAINRFLVKRKVIRSLKYSKLNFVITEEQKQLYEQITDKKFIVLKKTKDFKELVQKDKHDICALRFVFTGNIIYGRLKTLINIGRIIDKYNNDFGCNHILNIYTYNQLDKKEKEIINKVQSIQFREPVPSDEILNVLRQNDILLHVEATNKSERMISRLSFSTKIIDYLEAGRAIVAVGWKESASLNYLSKNSIGFCFENENELYNFLEGITEDELLSISLKSYFFGKENHSRNNDFINLLNSIK